MDFATVTIIGLDSVSNFAFSPIHRVAIHSREENKVNVVEK